MDFLTLFISLRCNQSCGHCLYGCSPEKGQHMTWGIFRKSLAIAREQAIPTINFFGGEPFMNPQLYRMMEATLQAGFRLILATNGKALQQRETLDKFLAVTGPWKDKVTVVTATDKFHLAFFDPSAVIAELEYAGYRVIRQNYADHTVALSPFNQHKDELRDLNHDWCCCDNQWNDYVGVLPSGEWTICPPSLTPFGNVVTHSFGTVLNFKRGLEFHATRGCIECLKDFEEFQIQFEKNYPNDQRC